MSRSPKREDSFGFLLGKSRPIKFRSTSQKRVKLGILNYILKRMPEQRSRVFSWSREQDQQNSVSSRMLFHSNKKYLMNYRHGFSWSRERTANVKAYVPDFLYPTYQGHRTNCIFKRVELEPEASNTSILPGFWLYNVTNVDRLRSRDGNRPTRTVKITF